MSNATSGYLWEGSRWNADAFDRAYERLSKGGVCDSPGRAEYHRVRAEWVVAGQPHPELFIRWRANDSEPLDEILVYLGPSKDISEWEAEHNPNGLPFVHFYLRVSSDDPSAEGWTLFRPIYVPSPATDSPKGAIAAAKDYLRGHPGVSVPRPEGDPV